MKRYDVSDLPEIKPGEKCKAFIHDGWKMIEFEESDKLCEKCCFINNDLYNCEEAKCYPISRKDGKNGIFVMKGTPMDRGGLYKDLHYKDYQELLILLKSFPKEKYVWGEREDDETPIVTIHPFEWDMHSCEFEVEEAFVEGGKVRLKGSVIDSPGNQQIDNVLGFVAFGDIYSITKNIIKS